MPLEPVEPTQWVVCPSLDEAGIHVESALQEARRVWWESRSHMQRLTDDQPELSAVLQAFCSEAEALAWRNMRESADKLKISLCRSRSTRYTQPVERIVLPGFSLAQLRNVGTPTFTGITF